MAGKSLTSYQRSKVKAMGQRQTTAQHIDTNPEGKIDFGRQWNFESHRAGWPSVLKALSKLHNPKGVLFDGFIEQNFGWYRKTQCEHAVIPYVTPWIGMVHNPQNMPSFFDYQSSPQIIFSSALMRQSLPYCNGLYVFSDYLKDWLITKVDCPVEVLIHPTDTTRTKFEFTNYQKNKNKKLIQVGFWLRKTHSIKHLHADKFKKIWLVPHDYAKSIQSVEANAIDIFDQEGLEIVGDYEEWDRLNDSEYDHLLSENLVFLDLYDSSANNTVLECISRNTPILVRKLPAVVEYLGKDYPLYFESLSEASAKLESESIIRDTWEYLKDMDKSRFSMEHFTRSFTESEIYRSIELPDNSKLLLSRTPNIDTLEDLNIVHGSPLATNSFF